LAGLKAYNDHNYSGAVEHFQTALAIAYEEEAPPDHLGSMLENLAVAFLSNGQPQRARAMLERWDSILAASASEPWVAEQKSVRDLLAPLIQLALTTPDTPASNPKSTSPESGGYAIHLVSLKFENRAQTSWAELKADYPSQLSDKNLIVKKVDLREKGTFYRVLAAPFASSQAANKICKELQDLGQYCAVMSLE